MNEEWNGEEYTEEQVEPEESRAERIAGSLGSLFGSAARSVGSAARGVVGGLSSATPRVVSNLSASSPIYQQLYQQPVEKEDDLSDLFEVPQEEDNDIYTDDLLELDEEEGVEDLLTVSQEDIMSGPRAKKKPTLKLVRTNKPYYPELTGLR